MKWLADDYDDEYNEIIYDKKYEVDEDEENDESAMYFDVPLPYRPIQIERRRR